MIRDYLRLIVFTFSLLLGIQVPAFIDQYKLRVDAHLIEARQNMAGFQLTADRYFSGNIERLIAHYKASEDQVFRSDAQSIEQIHLRVKTLEIQWQNLQKGAMFRAYYVLSQQGSELMNETFSQYNYTVPLNLAALLWGVSLAFISTYIFELLGLLSVRVLKSSFTSRRLQ
jgi:hypothetical protein